MMRLLGSGSFWGRETGWWTRETYLDAPDDPADGWGPVEGSA